MLSESIPTNAEPARSHVKLVQRQEMRLALVAKLTTTLTVADA